MIVVWTDANVSRSTAYDAAVEAAKHVHRVTSQASAAVTYDVRTVTQEEVAAARAAGVPAVDVPAEVDPPRPVRRGRV